MAAIVLFCLALMACLVLRANILYALLAGLVIFTLHGRQQGFSWKELGKMIGAGVKTSAILPSTTKMQTCDSLTVSCEPRIIAYLSGTSKRYKMVF